MAIVDDYVGSPATTPGADNPATGVEVVVPSDTVSLAKVSRSLYVGVSGNISVLMRDGSTATFLSVAIGYHPLRVQRVNATATTATNMVSLL